MALPHRALALTLALAAIACEVQNVPGSHSASQGGESVDEEQSSATGGPLLDVNVGDCELPPQVSCDASGDAQLLQVIGLDCPGGIPATGTTDAASGAIAIHDGSLGPYEQREGEKFLILSTGRAQDLSLAPEQLAAVCDDLFACPNTDHQKGPSVLPPPLDVNPVDSEQTCVGAPELVGSGDCSNSLFDQWAACGGGCEVWDYAELRAELTVPEQTYGLAFDFVFVTAEWPLFVGGGFNDMFVAWLESENWTGNIAFDGEGNPITVNAGFTDYTADELDGTGMEGHAGTRWLTTAFGAAPGETLQLVLAVFDLNDGAYDSAVLLDNFRWTCAQTPPTTVPVP